MNAIDLILTRRSVKAMDLKEPGPSPAELEQILRAGTRVPDHGKLTPWHIQVLDKPGQAALGDFLGRLFKENIPEANEKQVEFERQRPQRAPLLLVVTSKVRPHPKIPDLEQRLSSAAVCTTLLHAANALGYGAQWLTEWPAFRPEVREFLGHDREQDQIVGFVHIGSRDAIPEDRDRPELADVVSTWSGPA
ncbi:MAG: nitroreductase [Azospirillaceae bacterium]